MHRGFIHVEEVRFHPLNSSNVAKYLEFQTGFKKEDEKRGDNEVSITSGKSIRSREIDLVGSFYCIGISGMRWFTVVNIWDSIGGIEGGWKQMLGIYDKVSPNLFLSEIDDLRFNADARPLAAAPGSPDLQQLRADGFTAPLFIYEVAQAAPGAALDYLAAVRDERAPVLAEYGYTPFGLYESRSVDDEVVVFWASDVDATLRVNHAHDAALGLDDTVPPDDRHLAWQRRKAEFLLSGTRRETFMVPYPGTRHAPK